MQRPPRLPSSERIVFQRETEEIKEFSLSIHDDASDCKINPYAFTDPLNFLHVFCLLLCITKEMRCQICELCLLLDCTVLNCGHAFCKFCIINRLRLFQTCPVCLKTGVRPICNRCFQLDAFAASLHPIILDFITPESLNGQLFPVYQQVTDSLEISPLNDIGLQETRESDLQIASTERQNQLRESRRRTMLPEHLLPACRNHSMLDGILNLGFGLRHSIFGFIMIVIGCFFMTLSTCHLSDTLDRMGLMPLRRFIYVILIVYLLCSHNTTFFRHVGTNGVERRTFWEQIFRLDKTEEPEAPVKPDRKIIMVSIRNREFEMRVMKTHAFHIVKLFQTFE